MDGTIGLRRGLIRAGAQANPGSLSNLEYTLTVTDTKTGAVKTYRNPAGRYCGGTEIDAF